MAQRGDVDEEDPLVDSCSVDDDYDMVALNGLPLDRFESRAKKTHRQLLADQAIAVSKELVNGTREGPSPVKSTKPNAKLKQARVHMVPISKSRTRNRSHDNTYRILDAKDLARAPVFHGNEAERSKQEEYHTKFTLALINGVPGTCEGILRPANATTGKLVLPYAHQRQAVKMLFDPGSPRTSIIFSHDMGLGKTLTALLSYAATNIYMKRLPKALISVPAALIDQWEMAVCEWLRLPRQDILVVRTVSEATRAELIGRATIVLVSCNIVGLAFKKCHELVDVERDTGRGLRTVSEWHLRGGSVLGPLFKPTWSGALPHSVGASGTWDLFIVDEIHSMRTISTLNCQAHSCVISTRRIGLTGTMVVNKPDDLAGIATALCIPKQGGIDYKEKSAWMHRLNDHTVNRATVMRFYETFVHRASESILSLPPLEEKVVSYPVRFTSDQAHDYNECVAKAHTIRATGARNGKLDHRDVTELWAKIHAMQQMVICPELARVGAAEFEQHPEMLKCAAETPSSAVAALTWQVDELRRKGHSRIVIACDAVCPLKIAFACVQNSRPDLGECFAYYGSMPLNKRRESKDVFLKSDKSLLFLSIQAGGIGLHLVPGCEAMIFWSAAPYSPAYTRQCMKRIHRIGQTAPVTGRVTVVHMVPYGSVDYAIRRMHADKAALIAFTNDPTNRSTHFTNENDNMWRKAGRIVEGCLEVGDDGNFPTPPEYEADALAGSSSAERRPFEIVPGIKAADTTVLPPSALF